MNRVDIRCLPPELQELVNTIITGVVALASRANSNSGMDEARRITQDVYRKRKVQIP